MVVCTSDEEAKKSWCTFMGSLRLNKRLEYNHLLHCAPLVKRINTDVYVLCTSRKEDD